MNQNDHKVVQLARDDMEANDAYIGAEGELTIDESNWNIRLHDGSTPGGRVICSLDELNQLFQSKSNELSGFNFLPEQKGFLVRLGAATYRFRAIQVNTEALQIAKADGTEGNPIIDLADEITRDVGISGILTTSETIQATGGVHGDLSGDSTGTHHGNVVGNVEGNVTGNLDGDSTGKHTGDVDVRGKTLQLDDGQIHLASLNDDVRDYINQRSAPVGAILIWSGVVTAVPEFWQLCDGSNGTPDLRDKFILGAGHDFDVGVTGGARQATPAITIAEGGSHSHTGTVGGHALTIEEMPTHNHGNGICDTGTDSFNHGSKPAVPNAPQGFDNNHHGENEGITEDTGGGAEHTHDLDITDSGAHTHDVEADALSTMPPYYALAYIQRME